MLRIRTWLLALGALLAVCILASALLLHLGRPGGVVEVVQDGQVIREIDLSRVTEAYTFTVSWEGGQNIISVQPGRICVEDADCPDRICVGQGWLSDQAAPIVCLPHHLMIRVKDNADFDAVAR